MGGHAMQTDMYECMHAYMQTHTHLPMKKEGREKENVQQPMGESLKLIIRVNTRRQPAIASWILEPEEFQIKKLGSWTSIPANEFILKKNISKAKGEMVGFHFEK